MEQESSQTPQPSKPKKINKINVYNPQEVKQCVDEQIQKFFLKHLQFKENHSISNWKIIIGLISSVCAISAYFVKTNDVLVVLLCSVFIVGNALLYYISKFVEKNQVLDTKPNFGGSSVRISTDFKQRHSDKLKLEMQVNGKETKILEFSIGELFDEQGKLHKTWFRTQLQNLFNEMKKTA